MKKPYWIEYAEQYIGQREVAGAGNNPIIIGWLVRLKAWWRDDLTPWCATFVAECLNMSDMGIPKAWYRAKSYLDWGVPLKSPAYGCVVVFARTGGGHVGFVVGKDTRGRLLVLGGNQGDAVSIAPFEMARVEGYRWPVCSLSPVYELPVFTGRAKTSTNEA